MSIDFITPSTSPHLYAISQSRNCEGAERCHWCSAPCERRWVHDDVYPIPFDKTRSSARILSSPWICQGCWLFRVRKTTIWFLTGGFQDRQDPTQHSWLVTPRNAYALREMDREKLLHFLLDPPLTFSLSILDKEAGENLLHLCPVNCNSQLRTDTILHFNYNNIPHTYLVYELEEVIKRGKVAGKSPGVRMLADYLKPPVSLMIPEPKSIRKKGRPDGTEAPTTVTHRLVRESGGFRMSS